MSSRPCDRESSPQGLGRAREKGTDISEWTLGHYRVVESSMREKKNEEQLSGKIENPEKAPGEFKRRPAASS